MGYTISQSNKLEPIDDNEIEIEGIYSQHEQIIITRNSDFEEQGWPGNGSLMNPYIIEGLNISYSYYRQTYFAIFIKHTTVHFQIRNCLIMLQYLTLRRNAIGFENVSYGSTMNCFVINYEYGGLLRDSHNCSMINNTILSTGSYGKNVGFRIETSANCTLMNNNVVNGGHGYSISTSSNCKLVGNAASEIRYEAVYLGASNCCILKNNNFGETGIEIQGYAEANWLHELINNTLKENPIGYFKELTDTVIDGSGFGQIILVKCEDVIVRNYKSAYAVFGVGLGFCTHCTIENCYSSHNIGPGFKIQYSTDCTIRNCIATGSFNGYELKYCSNCNLMNNTAMYNTVGCSFYNTNNCTISNNVASSNERGFFSDHMNASKLFKNTIIDNENNGILLYASIYCIISNNTIMNNQDIGLFLYWGCANNEIYYNRFANNVECNAYDAGESNRWDDGISCGNYWHDYNGTGPYVVPTVGSPGLIDNFPQLWILPATAYDVTLILILSCIGLVIIVVMVEGFIRRRYTAEVKTVST